MGRQATCKHTHAGFNPAIEAARATGESPERRDPFMFVPYHRGMVWLGVAIALIAAGLVGYFFWDTYRSRRVVKRIDRTMGGRRR
jgi:hypothetical protein